MSHYNLLVILPPQVDFDCDGDLEIVREAMHLYDECNEVARAAKWDWYSVGGRWRGHFPIASGVSRSAYVQTHAQYPSIEAPVQRGRCDGGRLGALDIEGMRRDAGEKAEAAWNEYAAIIEGTPQPEYWPAFVERVNLAEVEVLGMTRSEAVDVAYETARSEQGWPLSDDAFWEWVEEPAQDGITETEAWKVYDARTTALIEEIKARHARSVYSIDRARRDYGAQPRVRIAQVAPAYKDWFMSDPVDEFDALTREEYVERQIAAVVPGFATLRITSEDPDCRRYEVQWMAAGEMGRFGMSSANDDSREFYHAHVNKLVDSLDDPFHVLLMLDCHI